jgi:hypothetical protein
MECFGTVVSASLQHGVPLKVLCNKLSHTRFEPSGWTGNPATTRAIPAILGQPPCRDSVSFFGVSVFSEPCVPLYLGSSPQVHATNVGNTCPTPSRFSSKPLIADPGQVLAARLKRDLETALTHRRWLLSKPASCSA